MNLKLVPNMNVCLFVIFAKREIVPVPVNVPAGVVMKKKKYNMVYNIFK